MMGTQAMGAATNWSNPVERGAVDARAAITDGHGRFEIGRVTVAAPAPGEVRVRMLAAGLCRTDHDSMQWGATLILGHEGSGTVVDVGAGVANVAPGDFVILNWAIPCGRCKRCMEGHDVLCEDVRPADPLAAPGGTVHAGATRWNGVPIDRSFNLGTLSECTLVRAAAVTRITSPIPPSSAALIGCGVMTGVGSVLNVARVAAGESVAVIGCGGVGLNVVQGARLAQASMIVAIDARPEALDRATALGATHSLLADGDVGIADRTTAAVLQLTRDRGVDHVFEATGRSDLALACLALVRNGGNCVLVSGSSGEATLDLARLWWNKRVIAPLYGDCKPSRDFPRLVEHYRRGELELDALVTRTYDIDSLADAFADMLDGRNSKGVIVFPDVAG